MLKSRHFIFLLLFTSSVFALSEDGGTNPYKNLRVLPFNAETMYSNAQKLEPLIKKYKVRTIIEIGSWLGASTRHMASLLPAGGKLYAIDHWKGSPEHQPGQLLWSQSLPYLYEQFLSNVVHAGLTEVIVPLRMTSLDGAKYLSSKEISVVPDLIYIDGDHTTEAVYEDLCAWYPFVKGHGILCGDDWGWGTVRVAVEAFAAEKHLRIEASDNFWRLHE